MGHGSVPEEEKGVSPLRLFLGFPGVHLHHLHGKLEDDAEHNSY